MYNHAVVGGTFDRLHIGHQAILDKAFSVAKQVTIAVTTDDFIVQKALSQTIEAYANRVHAVHSYIQGKGYTTIYTIIPLHDIYGVAIEDATMDAIIVSAETRENAVKINQTRSSKQMPALDIVEVNILKDTAGRTISSHRIRRGEIDRSGTLYTIPFSSTNILKLPIELRDGLQKPLGKLFHGTEVDEQAVMGEIHTYIEEQKPIMLITVGDIVSRSFKNAHISADLRIIDGQTRRQQLPTLEEFKHAERSINAAGMITAETTEMIRNILYDIQHKHTRKVIYIDGEEDLLALPCIVYAPLNAIIAYGLADQGVVLLTVSEDMKAWCMQLLRHFTS